RHRRPRQDAEVDFTDEDEESHQQHSRSSKLVGLMQIDDVAEKQTSNGHEGEDVGGKKQHEKTASTFDRELAHDKDKEHQDRHDSHRGTTTSRDVEHDLDHLVSRHDKTRHHRRQHHQRHHRTHRHSRAGDDDLDIDVEHDDDDDKKEDAEDEEDEAMEA
ncbi:unnamed protein product, partial [Amoebophrya sp. A25]